MLIRHVRKRYDSAGKTIVQDLYALYAPQEMFIEMLKDPNLGIVYYGIDTLDRCDPRILEL